MPPKNPKRVKPPTAAKTMMIAIGTAATAPTARRMRAVMTTPRGKEIGRVRIKRTITKVWLFFNHLPA